MGEYHCVIRRHVKYSAFYDAKKIRLNDVSRAVFLFELGFVYTANVKKYNAMAR